MGINTEVFYFLIFFYSKSREKDVKFVLSDFANAQNWLYYYHSLFFNPNKAFHDWNSTSFNLFKAKNPCDTLNNHNRDLHLQRRVVNWIWQSFTNFIRTRHPRWGNSSPLLFRSLPGPAYFCLFFPRASPHGPKSPISAQPCVGCQSLALSMGYLPRNISHSMFFFKTSVY